MSSNKKMAAMRQALIDVKNGASRYGAAKANGLTTTAISRAIKRQAHNAAHKCTCPQCGNVHALVKPELVEGE